MSDPQPELLKVVPEKRAEMRAFAAKVFERHGIVLSEDDPAFALVTLNELVLRKVIGELLKDVDKRTTARLGEFEKAMQRVEARACNVLGRQALESARGLSEALHEEIAGARLQILRMVEGLAPGRRIGMLAGWCAVCAAVAIVMLSCGFWIGRFYR